jgi:ribosomal protein L21E
MRDNAFKIGDQVEILPAKYRALRDLHAPFTGKTGTVVEIIGNSYIVQVHINKFHNTRHAFQHEELKHKTELTPETDAVFRDILRGV